MGSMFDENPSLIQEPYDQDRNASPWAKKNTPLVLIHDGGGTIFSYHCLGSLGRQVFGIANPHYENGESWEGGIPEMAAHYLKLIKTVVPYGDIIIGGWSLGGLISLEVAHQLAKERRKTLNLIGIIMVDSVCPMVLTAPTLPIIQHSVKWGEHTKQETKDRVMRSFAEAMKMVKQWNLPVWDDNKPAPNQGEKKKENNSPGLNALNGRAATTRPPPVILLRAMEPVPVPEEGVSRVDIHRADRLLGWGNYRKNLINKVMDIPGHHFNIFHTEENLEASTAGIKMACQELEDMHNGRLVA